MTAPHVDAKLHIDKNFTIKFTLFRDRFARFRQEREATLADLAGAIVRNKAVRKELLPLLKLATFGDMASPKGSLRWDNNLIEVTGVELDYDGGRISFDDARLLLIDAGIAAVIYTTPSHTDEHPRWRVLAPFSQRLMPGERGKMLARLNGALHGAAHPESFSLSQSYYYGYVTDLPRADVIEGVPINLMDELDAGAIGKSGKSRGENGANGSENYTEMEELIRRIVSGDSLHPSVLSIAGKMAARGDSKETCIEVVGGAFEAAKADRYTDARWKSDVLRAIDYVWAKEEAKHTPPPPPPEPEQEADPDWIKKCLMGKKDKPLSNLANALRALRSDPLLRTAFAFDEMLRTPMLTRSSPVPVTDDDIIDLQEFLQRAGLHSITRDTAKHALFSYAADRPYHPIRTFLEQLKWDQKPRLKTWTNQYLGAGQTPYTETVGPLFVISMIARVYRPGCKADHMLILEGQQGILKSMVCSILAGDEYFSDSMPEISMGKDVSVHLRGKWIVEIAEMHAFNRADSTHLKSFLSRTHERYRPPYAMMEVDEPRQVVFIGTSNKETYLRDETGGRRFWPIKTGTIAVDALRLDRNQLLAEAVHLFKAGAQWWPDKEFERAHIEPEQEARYEFDEWFNAVADYVRLISDTTIQNIAKNSALEIKLERLGQFEQRRIAAILRQLGWTAKRDKHRRWWEAPANRTGAPPGPGLHEAMRDIPPDEGVKW